MQGCTRTGYFSFDTYGSRDVKYREDRKEKDKVLQGTETANLAMYNIRARWYNYDTRDENSERVYTASV